ncbi:MAG: hypothetical protein CBE00_11060 [Planctomycetaceae bacterium TMED240]|nr:hypothetical protein [Rhodopirellula sp.]OUX05300.1 MAG: hypothetical protein CBE00_11060 [Planctomycetaceae bacterium TMED240]
MKSIQDLCDLRNWTGERGLYTGGSKVFASMFYACPVMGLGRLGGANACGVLNGTAGVPWLYL